MTSTFLLDTHTFLWWIADSEKLSTRARTCIANPRNQIVLSAISGWEIAIKAGLGRVSQVGDPESSVPFHAKRSSIKIEDFTLQAALRVFRLPPIHQDPFDRALIAHAEILEATVISADSIFEQYDVPVTW